MAVPVALGLVLWNPRIGFTIGLGAMLLGGGPANDLVEAIAPTPASALLPGLVAVVAATMIAGHRWTEAAMIALTTVAAAISGYSRPVGVAAIRFIVYFILSLTLVEAAGAHGRGAALVFGVGALWNVALRMLLAGKRPSAAAPAGRVVTARQRRAHLRRALRSLAGWQFALRMMVGLTAASVLRHLAPTHHYGWIVLTVALLTQRPVERVPVRATQRLFGTVLGVALTGLLVAVAGAGIGGTTPGSIGLAVVVCALAAVVPLMRLRNYLAYSALAAPVILLVVDFGRPVEAALLIDRLVATLVAGAIVVALNLAVARALRLDPPGAAAAPSGRGE